MTTEHPSFDALSAHFDGEAPETPGVDIAAHVAGCAECRRMLRWLETSSGLVATPVPPMAADAKEAALARAMDALESPPETVQTPVVLAEVRVRPSPRPQVEVTPIGDARRRAKGSGWWVGVGSAAAVVVALAIGVGVLSGGGGGDDESTTVAAGPTQERGAVGGSIANAGGGAEGLATSPDAYAGAGGVTGGDLGEMPDAATLAARAGPGLQARTATASADASSEAPAPPAAAAGGDLTPKVVGTRPCEMEARTARPGMGTVVYFATGRVDGTPVVVLGFADSPTDDSVTLLALAQPEGCRIVLEAAGP